MLNNLFEGLFASSLQTSISPGDFLLCMAVALGIGFLLALVYKRQCRSSQSFVTTLALLPTVVCVVIMLVNGNLGAGVAVAGAFSLVRFRSAPGTAKEIGAIFVAMAAGLASGMGYLGFAVLFAVVLCGAELLYSTNLLKRLCSSGAGEQMLRITIPEELDYSGVFDELFDRYTHRHELIEVKTTNMGSLFRLSYQIQVKESLSEKQMLDAIRCCNGNLEVSLSRQLTNTYEL